MKSSAGGRQAERYLRDAGVKRSQDGVACENTAAADVDRSEVSHEGSRTVGWGLLLGGRRGGTEIKLVSCQPFDQHHSAGAEGAELLGGGMWS